MKKLLLFAFLLPVAGWAQNYKALQPSNSANQPVLMKDAGVLKDGMTKPVKVGPAKTALNKKSLGTQIGTTFYDLQTNRAIPRRVKLYPDGKISVVWTNSNQITTPGYVDRGTAYNHFNGTNWEGQNATRPESDRAGWPSIVNITENGVEREMIVSHYAPASATLSSGGFFVMKNAGVGSYNFFEKIYKRPGGPIWPRMAASGDYVHIIANYTAKADRTDDTVFRNGVKQPTVYFRYRVSDSTFVTFDKALPGYDNTRYSVGSSDAYSIDARDNYVAILMGGSTHDVALWKSADYGATWKKTIVFPFAQAPYIPTIDTPFDTTESNDGAVHVTLDKSGTAHVFFPRMRVLNETPGDSSYSYFPGTSGIHYWNDKDTILKEFIAGTPDLDGDGTLTIGSGTTQRTAPSVSVGAAGYTTALSTFPSAAVDDSGNIYMIFSAPNETDVTADEQNFRDIFVVMSKDGGKNWSNILMLTDDIGKENVFASVARDADDKLHMVWMQDDEPGTVLTNEDIQSTTPNAMMYAAIPLEQIKNGTLTGIKASNLIKDVVLGTNYPNPASETLYIPVSMAKTANVTVKVMNMLGQEVQSYNFGMLSEGKNLLNLNVKDLSKGVYFYNLTAGNATLTQKIVVE